MARRLCGFKRRRGTDGSTSGSIHMQFRFDWFGQSRANSLMPAQARPGSPYPGLSYWGSANCTWEYLN